METSFAQGLRALRQKKALSQSELARRSGLALRTLSYWESGGSLPRIPELQAALNALEATPEESAALLNLLHTPRALRLAAKENPDSIAEEFAGAGTGDLLRAMRLRRRMTQAELAAQMGVSRLSALRWETGQNLVSSENLERFCALLGASPEERQSLQTRRLTTPQGEADGWRKVTVAEAWDFWRETQRPHDSMAPDYRPQSPLFELQVLAMKRHLHLHAEPGEQSRPFLIQLQNDHAVWLNRQNRLREAKGYLDRALLLAREEAVPQDFWGEMLNLAASEGYAFKVGDGAFAGLRLMEEWLPRLPPGFVRTQQLCDIALFAGQLGNKSKALAFMRQAERSMNRTGDITASETYYYDLTMERLKLNFGKTLEISAELLAQCPNNYQRIHVALLWTRKLLHTGERQAASRYLSQAKALLTPEIPERLRQFVLDFSLQI